MHSPKAVAFNLRQPWPRFHSKEERERVRKELQEGKLPFRYYPSIITIWHNDPEKDGTDDSCGWFLRPRHLNKVILERIVKRYQVEWDGTYKSSGKTWNRGWFSPDGDPVFSTTGILANMVFFVIWEQEYVRNGGDGGKCWGVASKFVNSHYGDIAIFAENTTDSMNDSIRQVFGSDGSREERIRSIAGIVYAWVARLQRPWYRHPKWHIHHWSIQIHPLDKLKAWLFNHCCVCGKGFGWNESSVTNSWNAQKPRWFWKGKPGIYHYECHTRIHATPAEPHEMFSTPTVK